MDIEDYKNGMFICQIFKSSAGFFLIMMVVMVVSLLPLLNVGIAGLY